VSEQLPSKFVEQLRKLPIVVRYELLKQLRRFRLYGLLAIGSLATFAGVILASYFLGGASGTTASDFSYLIVTLGEFGYFSLIAGVFFSGDAISSEFEHKTGYLMFLNPVTRTTLLIGKYLSSCIACVLVVTTPYFILSLGVMLIYGELPTGLLLSYLFAVFYACSVAALTFVFSSLFKGSMGASILPFLLIFFVFPIIMAVLMIAGYEPFLFINYGAQVAQNILLDTYPPNKLTLRVGAGGFGITVTEFYATVAEGVIIMGSYLVIGLILSALIMRRRQMT
jgi:ABC-type transport system involved in multi-copper enzyme maturation permease subunit